MTEWAKKQGCWDRVRDLRIDWPRSVIGDLLSVGERRDAIRAGRREQRVLNGIEAQTAVVNAGADFWKGALKWGISKKVLSETESGIIGYASRAPTTIPSEKQSVRAIQILEKLQEAGYSGELPRRS